MGDLKTATPDVLAGNPPRIYIHLTIDKGLLPRFFKLLEKGFMLEAQTGCSIKELLCSQFAIPEVYLEERVQTIFLDANAVDDVNRAMVSNRSTLALSASMPGVAGAMLRKGGHYAAMRSQISFARSGSKSQAQKGRIILKLFNLVAKELGPKFLRDGIWLEGRNFEHFCLKHGIELQKHCRRAECDANTIAVSDLTKLDLSCKLINLRLSTEPAPL